MNLQLWALSRAGNLLLAEGETPTPRPTFNPDDVGPGVESFLIAFILAVALLFLLWSMSRHMRRVQVRAKLRDEAEAAAGSVDGGSVDDPTDENPPGVDSRGPDSPGPDSPGPDSSEDENSD